LKTVVTITLPDGNHIAQVWDWGDIAIVPWWQFFRPIADMVTDATWHCEPIAEHQTDKNAFLGY
jgi:hypothetical protein